MTLTSNEPNRSVTPRGFDIYDAFVDDHGHSMRVQESSAASEPKVWVFIEDTRDLPSPPHCTTPDHLHLNVEGATRLRNALDAFLTEHG